MITLKSVSAILRKSLYHQFHKFPLADYQQIIEFVKNMMTKNLLLAICISLQLPPVPHTVNILS